MTDMTDRDRMRDTLLCATLPHVVFEGWTDAALDAGAADAGMDALEVKRFFPGGVAGMVEHFSDWADRRMAGEVAGHDLEGLGARQRVQLAVRLRFEALAPHREAVRRTLSWLVFPVNAPLAAKCLYCTVDAIWRAVGDRSSDFSFYTKRALLAAVLGATALYWLEDDSIGYGESWGFLERRLGDVLKIPALGARARGLVSALPNPFRILRGFS